MRNFSGRVCSVLFLLMAAGLFAQDFHLVFLDGDVDIHENGQWTPLVIGEAVSQGSRISLSEGTLAEFSGPRGTILFSSAGTYRLGLSEKAPDFGQNTAVSSIFNRLSKAGGNVDRGKSEVMGVRGSEAMENEGFTWMDEDSSNFEEALEAFADQDFELVIEILENDVDPIVLDDPSAYWYHLAASYDALGRMGPALKILRSHSVENFSSSYRDYLFLEGRLYFESRNYTQAVDSFDAFVREESGTGKTQLAFYMLGAAFLEQGKTKEGNSALEEAIRINADAELTALARKLLP